MSNQLRRIITALVAAPVFLGVAYWGGWAFGGLVIIIALVGQWELYAMAERGGLRPRKFMGLILGVVVGVQAIVPDLSSVVIFGVILLIVASPFIFPQERVLSSLSVTLFGLIYPVGLLAYLVRLRLAQGPMVGDWEAFLLVLLVLFLVWAADIFAYYVGKYAGRRKLAPVISPNKTWEGSLGGLGAAVLVAVGFKAGFFDVITWLDAGVLAVLCGGVGQLGDLAVSQMKRATGVDDAGTILPGHGGVLDRFDALLIAVPLAYLYLDLVVGLFH